MSRAGVSWVERRPLNKCSRLRGQHREEDRVLCAGQTDVALYDQSRGYVEWGGRKSAGKVKA